MSVSTKSMTEKIAEAGVSGGGGSVEQLWIIPYRRDVCSLSFAHINRRATQKIL